MDSLAKQAAKLPMPNFNPTSPHSIVLGRTQAPTPAKKWVSSFRRCAMWAGCDRMTWLPMLGACRMIWIQWLWGYVPWEGCAVP